MIHDVDQLLEKLVKPRRPERLARSSSLFDAPTKDWVARRNAPTVDLYLYDIREDLQRRVPAWEDVRGTRRARSTRRQPPPRRFRLVVPRDRLDPAPRGRAPPAVVAALVLPAQPDAHARRSGRRDRSPSRPARLHRRRPAAAAGPVARRRLVGARRRAQAVARRRGHGAARSQLPAAAAGPRAALGLARRPDAPDAVERAAAAASAAGEPMRRASRARGRPARAPSREPPPDGVARPVARHAGRRERPTRERACRRPEPAGDPGARHRRRPMSAARPRARPAAARSTRRSPTSTAGSRSSRRASGPPSTAAGRRPRPGRPVPRPVHLGRAGRRAARRAPAPRRRGGRGRPRRRRRWPRDRGGGGRGEAAGADLRLRRLARAFGLDAGRRRAAARRPRAGPRPALRAAVRLPPRRRLAAAGERGPRAGAARRRLGATARLERGRLGPHGPLVAGGLLLVEDARPAVPDPVAARPGPRRGPPPRRRPARPALAALLVDVDAPAPSATWSRSRARSTRGDPARLRPRAAGGVRAGRWRARRSSALGPPGRSRSTSRRLAPTTTPRESPRRRRARRGCAARRSSPGRWRRSPSAGPAAVRAFAEARLPGGPGRHAGAGIPAWSREAPLRARRARPGRSAQRHELVGRRARRRARRSGFDPAAATLALPARPGADRPGRRAARPDRGRRRRGRSTADDIARRRPRPERRPAWSGSRAASSPSPAGTTSSCPTRCEPSCAS